jgi:hypothetical protein
VQINWLCVVVKSKFLRGETAISKESKLRRVVRRNFVIV